MDGSISILAAAFNWNQALLMAGQATIVALLILGMFQARTYFGLVPLFVTIGVFQHVQVVLAGTVYVELYPGFIISPGSVVMFSAGFFAILLVYVKEDAVEARKLGYGILGANIAMALLSYLFSLGLVGEGIRNVYDLPRDFFVQNVRIIVVGTLALLIDIILVIYVYEFVSRWTPRSVFLRAGLALVITLTVDTLIFATGSFVESPEYVSILLSGIVGKSAAALFYAAILDLFFRWSERRRPGGSVEISDTPEFRDVFHFLTFREKYKMMKDLHDELQSSQKSLHKLNEHLDDIVRQRTVALEETQQQLRALGTKLRSAQESERIQISRDIHDELGQLLTALKFDVRWLEEKLSSKTKLDELNPLIDRAVAASELVDMTIATVREIAGKLRPGGLDRLGLAAALSEYLRDFEQRYQISATLTVDEPEPEIRGELGNELFFICQEALTNVARHSKANSVSISLVREGDEVVLEICDDGIGIDLGDKNAAAPSLGLLGMKERALQCGGSVELAHRRSGGTRVSARVPLKRHGIDKGDSA